MRSMYLVRIRGVGEGYRVSSKSHTLKRAYDAGRGAGREAEERMWHVPGEPVEVDLVVVDARLAVARDLHHVVHALGHVPQVILRAREALRLHAVLVRVRMRVRVRVRVKGER